MVSTRLRIAAWDEPPHRRADEEKQGAASESRVELGRTIWMAPSLSRKRRAAPPETPGIRCDYGGNASERRTAQFLVWKMRRNCYKIGLSA
jgi:hypothetical protein